MSILAPDDDNMTMICNNPFLDDAQDIIDSDFEVKNVPLRNRSDKGKYLCKFCPITQKHQRGFDRKEDMKRHYHQHLNVSFY